MPAFYINPLSIQICYPDILVHGILRVRASPHLSQWRADSQDPMDQNDERRADKLNVRLERPLA